MVKLMRYCQTWASGGARTAGCRCGLADLLCGWGRGRTAAIFCLYAACQTGLSSNRTPVTPPGKQSLQCVQLPSTGSEAWPSAPQISERSPPARTKFAKLVSCKNKPMPSAWAICCDGRKAAPVTSTKTATTPKIRALRCLISGAYQANRTQARA